MFENGTETTQRGLHVTIPHKQGHGKSTVQEKTACNKTYHI